MTFNLGVVGGDGLGKWSKKSRKKFPISALTKVPRSVPCPRNSVFWENLLTEEGKPCEELFLIHKVSYKVRHPCTVCRYVLCLCIRMRTAVKRRVRCSALYPTVALCFHSREEREWERLPALTVDSSVGHPDPPGIHRAGHCLEFTGCLICVSLGSTWLKFTPQWWWRVGIWKADYNSTLTSSFPCVLTEGAWMMQCSVIILPYKAICNGFLFIHSTFCEQLLCTSLWAKELKYLVSDFTIYMYFPPKSFAFKMINPLSFSAECIHCLHWDVSWWRLHFLCVKLCRVKYLVSGISKWTHLSKIWILKSVINLLQVKEREVFWHFSF